MKVGAVGRWILTSDGVKKGYLRIKGNEVLEICWGDLSSESTKAIVLPAFVNAHTHIGDAVAYPAPRGSVKEIVGPPDGYKHRILRARSAEDKTAAMRSAIHVMKSCGTALFSDFREEGIQGLRFFRNAIGEDWPRPIVLGRPEGMAPTDAEIEVVLSASDGLGFSAISDWPADLLKEMSKRAKARGKLFAIHASEASREDIGSILDLNPDFLVHMCHATADDLVACRDANVPVVVCPTANRFFGLEPDIPGLLKAGVTVGLGTDNGMITKPDILAELKTAFTVSNARARISPLEIVRLATFGGRKVLNADAKITTEICQDTDLVVVRVRSDDPLRDLVTRAKSEDIIATIRGGKVWRTSDWMK